MNKDKINSKIEDLEAELQELKLLANEPEPRTPKAGDVWDLNGYFYIADDCGFGVVLEDGIRTAEHLGVEEEDGRFTYLGKFDEVYVKISDIRDAVITYNYQGSTVMSTEALRKLNIIQD